MPLAVGMALLVAGGAAVAQTTNGQIPLGNAQQASYQAQSASDSLNLNDVRGLDTQIDHQTFDVQHQQMLTLTTTGLGINVGTQTPDPVNGGYGVTQALDVAGYTRLRPTNPSNGEGGVVEMDGAPTATFANGQRIWLANNQGSFMVLDDTQSKPLFQVDQTGNVTAMGNMLANGEVQTIGGLRLTDSAPTYGSLWVNDGVSTYILLTNAGDAWGSPNGLRPLTINDSTGAVSFGNGVNLTNGGVTFPDATAQGTASNYGGEYSMIQPANGGPATCSKVNYKSSGCSCPAAFPNAHQFINFPVAASGTLQVFSCSSD